MLNLANDATVVLTKADSATVITYTWKAADFGLSLVVNYYIQVDRAGNNFKDATVIGQTINTTTFSIITYDLNSKLLPLETDPTAIIPLALEYRVMASVSNTYTPSYSAVIKQTITPFNVPIPYPLLFVPGNYQGWNPADSVTSIASLSFNTKYEGYLWMASSALEFKFTQGPAWTTNWGGSAGVLSPGGANITTNDAPGYYKLNVDLSSLTYAALKTTWSVIGDAVGGWSTDNDMVYDSIAKTWSVTMAVTTGNLKFRANHGWDLNYGDKPTPDGTLVSAGANIPSPGAGNYTICLLYTSPSPRD